MAQNPVNPNVKPKVKLTKEAEGSLVPTTPRGGCNLNDGCHGQPNYDRGEVCMQGITAIAKILKMEGVEFVSGFPQNSVFEAGSKEGIRPIITRNERVGVGIADGFTRSFAAHRRLPCAEWSGRGELVFRCGAGLQRIGADISIAGGSARRRLLPPTFIASRNFREITKWVDMINFADRVPR
jgi:acetolactate synthase-1/2/3 large subunit